MWAKPLRWQFEGLSAASPHPASDPPVLGFAVQREGKHDGFDYLFSSLKKDFLRRHYRIAIAAAKRDAARV